MVKEAARIASTAVSKGGTIFPHPFFDHVPVDDGRCSLIEGDIPPPNGAERNEYADGMSMKLPNFDAIPNVSMPIFLVVILLKPLLEIETRIGVAFNGVKDVFKAFFKHDYPRKPEPGGTSHMPAW